MFSKLPKLYWGNFLVGVFFFAYLAHVAVVQKADLANAFDNLSGASQGRALKDRTALDDLFKMQAEGQISMEELHTRVRNLAIVNEAEERKNVGYAFLAGTGITRHLEEVLSDDQIDEIKNQQLETASQISVFFSSIFFMLMAFYIIFSQNESTLTVVKRSSLKKRLDYCITINLYICFFSCLFNTVQLGTQDDIQFGELKGNHTLDLGRPIEWILTCPLMQLCLPILGGDKVHDSRTWTMPMTAIIILAFGTTSALVNIEVVKILMYLCGACFFLVLCYLINECIRDSTNNMESLFSGSGSLRAISLLVVLTWIPFPIWYALSPEGFNIIKNSPAMKVAVAFLNVISKGTFTLYLMRMRDDQRLRDKVVSENIGMEGDSGEKKFGVAASFVVMIQESLATIGRGRDFEDIMKILEMNMITCPDDLLVLTQAYCDEVHLPWAFVFAFKDQWRRMKVNNADAWQLAKKEAPLQPKDYGLDFSGAVSPSAPHVAKNPEKLQKVLERINPAARDANYDSSSYDMKTLGYGDWTGPGSADAGNETAIVSAGGDVGMVVRDAEERLLERLDEMVNARVMQILDKNLKKQREGH